MSDQICPLCGEKPSSFLAYHFENKHNYDELETAPIRARGGGTQ